jgi:hypothetical protein
MIKNNTTDITKTTDNLTANYFERVLKKNLNQTLCKLLTIGLREERKDDSRNNGRTNLKTGNKIGKLLVAMKTTNYQAPQNVVFSCLLFHPSLFSPDMPLSTNRGV